MAEAAEKKLVTRQNRGIYYDVKDLQEAFEQAAKRANLLSPMSRISKIPDMHGISLNLVYLEFGETGRDLYQEEDSRGTQEWSLTGRALDKIAACAGISWDYVLSGRLDDRSDPAYCSYRAVGWITDFDNSRRQIGGEKEVDFRKGSPQITGWTEKRLLRARMHILALAESKAKNRAIRHALAIKSKYTVDELRRPFVVPKLVLDPETIKDKELKRAVSMKIAERALGIVPQLYGPGIDAPALSSVPIDSAIGKVPPPPITHTEPLDAQGEEDCGCPDAPKGIHLEACPQRAMEQVIQEAQSQELEF